MKRGAAAAQSGFFLRQTDIITHCKPIIRKVIITVKRYRVWSGESIVCLWRTGACASRVSSHQSSGIKENVVHDAPGLHHHLLDMSNFLVLRDRKSNHRFRARQVRCTASEREGTSDSHSGLFRDVKHPRQYWLVIFIAGIMVDLCLLRSSESGTLVRCPLTNRASSRPPYLYASLYSMAHPQSVALKLSCSVIVEFAA
jgi:hypothetical protein